MTVQPAFSQLVDTMQNAFPTIAEPLEAGATEETLQALEAKLGFKVPADLRELWKLCSGSGENAFFGECFFQSPEFVVQDDILMWVEDNRANAEDSDATAEELSSTQWVPFADQGYADGLALCAVSGRVFRWSKGFPLSLVGASLSAFLQSYSENIRGGEYQLAEGFSDHGFYLERVE